MGRFLLLVAALAAPVVGCSAQRSVATPTASCALAPAGSPLQGAQIGAVRPLVGKVESENKRVAFTRVVGAEIVLLAPSISAEELEHRARCHAPAAIGADDPFAVGGATVRVRPEGGALHLQITSADPDAAREIVSRAQRLPL